MMVRTTVYLNDDLNERLRRLVPNRGLNRFINDAVADKIHALEEQRLIAEMREGYIATREDRDDIAREWDAVDLEGWPE
jgi:metal-responsive CopG/Arc/MetJ family transcriptional regulator